MVRWTKMLPLLGLAGMLSACSTLTDLETENQNNPDAERALSEPGNVEGLILSTYSVWNYGFNDLYPAWGLSVAGDEASSSWGNFHMQDASVEPRKAFENTTSYGYRGHVTGPWYNQYEAISNVRDGLFAIKNGLEIGEDGADTPRALAFGKFVQGLAHGHIALFFDRGFIFDEDIDLTTTPLELQDYGTVMAAAIGYLEEAIQIAQSSPAFTIPAVHIGNMEVDNTRLAQVAHSYIASFMAMNARDPAERAAVNWQEVINHVDAGITRDWGLIGDGFVNWGNNWVRYLGFTLWHRADYKTVGWADQTGNPNAIVGLGQGTAFQNWLNTPVAARQPFDIVTVDRRVSGPNPGDPGTDFGYRFDMQHREDRGTYHWSRYYLTRHAASHVNYTGFVPLLPLAEMEMLKAEAYLRMNQLDQAVPLINKYRTTRGQVPAVTAALGQNDLFQIMKYEKNIETFGVHAGRAFFDKRGWADLPEGTPRHWPIPALELETLALPWYTTGGTAGETVAPPGSGSF